MLKRAVGEAGLTSGDQQLPARLHVQHGINRMSKHVHYYFNYSATPLKFSYAYGDGTDLLDGKAAAHGQEIEIGPWDLAIVEER